MTVLSDSVDRLKILAGKSGRNERLFQNLFSGIAIASFVASGFGFPLVAAAGGIVLAGKFSRNVFNKSARESYYSQGYLSDLEKRADRIDDVKSAAQYIDLRLSGGVPRGIVGASIRGRYIPLEGYVVRGALNSTLPANIGDGRFFGRRFMPGFGKYRSLVEIIEESYNQKIEDTINDRSLTNLNRLFPNRRISPNRIYFSR